MKKSNKRGDKDPISGLPDEVLLHILSNLKTVEVGRTCILSSRWKNLWKSIRNLDFHFTIEQYENCGAIINKVLHSLQSESIQRFHLYARIDSLKDRYIEDYIPKWVAFAAEHNVCELSLNVDCEYISLPKCVLTSESLVKLTLRRGNFGFDIRQSLVSLPSLKSLYISIFNGYYLSLFGIRNASHLWKMFRGCPLLEDLTIKAMMYEIERSTFELILPSLKTLSIYMKTSTRSGFYKPDKFVVEAHNLEYLHISTGEILPHLVMGDAPKLQKVSLCGKIRCLFATFKDSSVKTMELLSGIRYTRYLSLMNDAIRVLNRAFYGNMPTFSNLIDLEVELKSHDCVNLLRHFLLSSPNLQSLTLDLDRDPYIPMYQDDWPFECLESVDFDWFDDDYLPSYLLSFVKRIQMKNVAKRRELEAVKYVLKHATTLESFSVEIKSSRLRNIILGFPKSSTLCEIEFL